VAAEVLEKELVYQLVGCAMRVHREVGYGLREETYERALCVELAHNSLKYDQQLAFPVFYRGQKMDDYIPDMAVEQRVLIDAKTIDAITDTERGQMLNYLRITGYRVGLIINFKHPSLQRERMVLDPSR